MPKGKILRKKMYQILNYNFEGPFLLNETNFNEVAAIYVIVDDLLRKIDVGETDNLKVRLVSHERKDCWQRNANRGILISALVEQNQENRKKIEGEIRSSFFFPCGKV